MRGLTSKGGWRARARTSTASAQRAVVATIEPAGVAARSAWSGSAGNVRSSVSRAAGFSLVEGLVALVIVSVGLLGVGQLMLLGMQAGASALMRTQAVYLLNDIMERIRANPAGQDAYDCAAYAPGPTARGCSPSGVPAVQCTARELAEDDLARWQQLARQALPLRGGGPCDANVRYLSDAAEPGVAGYEVEITWHERGQDAPASISSVLLLNSDVRA